MTTAGEHLVASSTIETGTAMEHFSNLNMQGLVEVTKVDVELLSLEANLGPPILAEIPGSIVARVSRGDRTATGLPHGIDDTPHGTDDGYHGGSD